MVIIIRSAFEDGKFPQAFSDDLLYECTYKF